MGGPTSPAPTTECPSPATNEARTSLTTASGSNRGALPTAGRCLRGVRDAGVAVKIIRIGCSSGPKAARTRRRRSWSQPGGCGQQAWLRDLSFGGTVARRRIGSQHWVVSRGVNLAHDELGAIAARNGRWEPFDHAGLPGARFATNCWPPTSGASTVAEAHPAATGIRRQPRRPLPLGDERAWTARSQNCPLPFAMQGLKPSTPTIRTYPSSFNPALATQR